jgi:hypothetical protein
MIHFTSEEIADMAAYDAKIDAGKVTVKMRMDIEHVEREFGLPPELTYKQQRYYKDREKMREYNKTHMDDCVRRNREYKARKKAKQLAQMPCYPSCSR